MFKAKFLFDTWFGVEENVFEGDSLGEIVNKLNEKQDLGCLVHQAYMFGTDEDIKEIVKLESFLNNYHSDILTVDDFVSFKIHLSIGTLECVEIEEL